MFVMNSSWKYWPNAMMSPILSVIFSRVAVSITGLAELRAVIPPRECESRNEIDTPLATPYPAAASKNASVTGDFPRVEGWSHMKGREDSIPNWIRGSASKYAR